MSDDSHQHQTQQNEEPKLEDANTPMNIKARIFLVVHSACLLSSFLHFLGCFFFFFGLFFVLFLSRS